MKIPRLVWNRRHNVASLTVSYGRRIWNTREVGDLILGFNAAGRLSRIVLLDPKTMLPPDAGEAEALTAVTEALLRAGSIRQSDLDVLKSALERAPVRSGDGDSKAEEGPDPEDPSPWPSKPDRSVPARRRGGVRAP